MGKSRRLCVISSMRNEGAFLIEWLAWYRMLGFSDALIVTNHCTDHSPELLDLLEKHLRGVHHLRVDPPPGQSIHLTKINAAKDHRVVRWAEWVFVCDADEFLVIHKGNGRIDDLIGPPGQPAYGAALGIALNWRVYGNTGVAKYLDMPVHQQFIQAVPIKAKVNHWIKTLFRQPGLFGRFNDHGPDKLDVEQARLHLGADPMAFVSASGKPVEEWSPTTGYTRRAISGPKDFGVAQINHYMLRSKESWTLKAGSPSPAAGKDRYNGFYLRRANSGNMIDGSALRYVDLFETERRALMALPGVARLHYLCCADHLSDILKKAGKDPAADPRVIDLVEKANASDPAN